MILHFLKKSYNDIKFYEKPKMLITAPQVTAKNCKLVTWKTACIPEGGRHSESQLPQVIAPGMEGKASLASKKTQDGIGHRQNRGDLK